MRMLARPAPKSRQTPPGILPSRLQQSPRMTAPANEQVVHELVELLSLERLEDNLFRGQSRDIGTKYVFGGQVLGQALSAAQATMQAPRGAHSLHA